MANGSGNRPPGGGGGGNRPPRERREREHHGAGACERGRRNEPGEEPEPACGRRREHGWTEFVDELALDCRSGLPGG
jgi:hypothetical protein